MSDWQEGLKFTTFVVDAEGHKIAVQFVAMSLIVISV